MSDTAKKGLHGWPIVGVATLAVLLCSAAMVLMGTDPVQQVRGVIRITARTSVTLFLLAFTAAALWQFWPNAWTRWQRQNRRYLGVSFAASHGVHLAALLTLYRIAPDEFLYDGIAITLIFGGLAYVFIAAMTATSFDRTAAAIGPRAWKILHTVGSYYIWLIFLNSYATRAMTEASYVPIALLLIGALVLRVAARIAKARARQPLQEKGQAA
jgi:methionine sulfoxide reductase heme-binding subunit